MPIESSSQTPRYRFMQRLLGCNPVWVAFFGSLILSAIAYIGTGIPNRDGVLYLETAEIFSRSGFAAARANFDWAFFPVGIAYVSKATGLSLAMTAYALCALLLAGACATAVRIAQRQNRHVGWLACLIVLALPAINDHRDQIIREFGWWLFSLQAVLAAQRWQERPTLSKGLTVQASLILATLFRLEGAAFAVALALWQLRQKHPWTERIRRLATLLWIPASAGILILVLMVTGHLDLEGRLAYYASAANPLSSFTKFSSVATEFAKTTLNQYSADEATTILFFGLFSTIVIKFFTHFGAFAIPLAFTAWDRNLRKNFSAWQPQRDFFIVYAVILVAFIVFNLFISSRYIAFLNILSIPLIVAGFQGLVQSFPRWRWAFYAVAALTLLSGSISISPHKTQFRQAGHWIEAHPEMAGRTYIDSIRTGFFAGGPYLIRHEKYLTREQIVDAVADGRFDYVVVEIRRNSSENQEWANSPNLEEIKRFSSKAGDPVVIFRKKELSGHGVPAP